MENHDNLFHKVFKWLHLPSTNSDILQIISRNIFDDNQLVVERFTFNIGSGNGLVPLGNKPLPEPMLTQIYVIT